MNIFEFFKKFFRNTSVILSLIFSAVACYYAIKAYEVTQEISFPKDDAHSIPDTIASMDKETDQFIDFLADNRHRAVYINVMLDSSISIHDSSVDYGESNSAENQIDTDESNSSEDDPLEPITITIWTECYDEYKEGDNFEWTQCTGVEIAFLKDGSNDAGLSFYHGHYYLSGYFSVVGFSGPYQGMMSVVLRGEKIKP